MNAQELFTTSGKSVGIWYCEQCGLINRDREFVENCCVCRFCGKVIEDRKREYTGCHSSCWRDDNRKRMLERLDQAVELKDYAGPLYSIDGYGQDGYIWDDVEEVICDGIESVEDWPEFMFACKPIGFPNVQVDSIVEQCAESLYEDAYEHITIPESLIKGVREFNKANEDMKAWEPDYKHKVRVPPCPADLVHELAKLQDEERQRKDRSDSV